MKRIFFLLCAVLLLLESNAQTDSSSVRSPSDKTEILPPFLYVHAKWVDSVLNSMTLDEKIGQLFMVPCWSKKSDSEMVHLPELINTYHIGGIIFMQGGPVRQASLTNYFQNISKVPLIARSSDHRCMLREHTCRIQNNARHTGFRRA